MVTIMDIETTSAPRTESISACMTAGGVATSVAHATALPASQVITMDITESAPVAAETSQDAGIMATAEAVTSTDSVITVMVEVAASTDVIMVTVEAAASTTSAPTAHASRVM